MKRTAAIFEIELAYACSYSVVPATPTPLGLRMTPASLNSDELIRSNVEIHDQIATKYDSRHSEIFNTVEQARLRASLKRAAGEMRPGLGPLRALDFGCGSGNLTGHLLDLGFEVVAADVSPRFLQLIETKYSGQKITTHNLNGRDMAEISDASFDFVATYSVLHHVPDYLHAVREMGRVCKSGGVIYIDHERTDEYYSERSTYNKFKSEGVRLDFRKFLKLSNYVGKLRRIFIDPKYANEGDIHVWPDDHIEWKLIEETLLDCGGKTVMSDDYLVFDQLYIREVYEKYKDICTDTRVMAFRKSG